jgi:hypothetical protein
MLTPLIETSRAPGASSPIEREKPWASLKKHGPGIANAKQHSVNVI